MPTIDQLAPATAASDNDELAGQPKRHRPQGDQGAGSGRASSRSSRSVPEPCSAAPAAARAVPSRSASAPISPDQWRSFGQRNSIQHRILAAGTVPASSDLVPLAQGGGNAAVTYSQFMSGLAGITNVDVSQLLVTPTGRTVADQTWRSRREYAAIVRRHADRRTDLAADPACRCRRRQRNTWTLRSRRRYRRRAALCRAG